MHSSAWAPVVSDSEMMHSSAPTQAPFFSVHSREYAVVGMRRVRVTIRRDTYFVMFVNLVIHNFN